ncbi:MAG: DNA-binding protein [Anaerolineales bacterium]
MKSDPITISVNEAIRVSGLGRTSINKALKEGRLTRRKWGTRTLIDRAELTALLTTLPVKK